MTQKPGSDTQLSGREMGSNAVLAEIDQQLHLFISNLGKLQESESESNKAIISEIAAHLEMAHCLIHNDIKY
jgi:hypothetical protein